MEVRLFEPDDMDFENCEFADYFKIKVDGKDFMSFIEGDTFSDIHRMPELLKLVYEAGLKKEEFVLLRK